MVVSLISVHEDCLFLEHPSFILNNKMSCCELVNMGALRSTSVLLQAKKSWSLKGKRVESLRTCLNSSQPVLADKTIVELTSHFPVNLSVKLGFDSYGYPTDQMFVLVLFFTEASVFPSSCSLFNSTEVSTVPKVKMLGAVSGSVSMTRTL